MNVFRQLDPWEKIQDGDKVTAGGAGNLFVGVARERIGQMADSLIRPVFRERTVTITLRDAETIFEERRRAVDEVPSLEFDMVRRLESAIERAKT